MPITLDFDSTDLLRCRFAISPAWETLSAARALLRPEQHGIHLPWLRAMMSHQPDLRAGILPLLLPEHGYTPDFLTPPPVTPIVDIEEELKRIRETPAERVAAELGRVAASTAEPSALRRLIENPARAREDLAVLIHDCWSRLLAPDWSRIRDTLDGDITYRARRLTDGGIEALVADLHVAVRWQDHRLVVAGVDGSRDLAGLGLLFIPSVFTWPKVSVITDPPWQPALIYPAWGIGTLWTQATPAAPKHLAALLGRTRAAVLYAIQEPISTTNLASRMGISPATASAHLTVLRQAGLASAHRAGHQVRYGLSALGHQVTRGQG